MLRLKKVKLDNWRNFGSAELTLDERLFVVGANASGKSNLLDVFRFLKDVTLIGLLKSVEKRGGIKKLRFLNARNQNSISILVTLHDEKGNSSEGDERVYHLVFNTTSQFGSVPLNISVETVTLNGLYLLDRKFSDEHEDYTSRQFTHLEHPTTNAKFRILYEYFKEISYVNIIPQLIRESGSFIPSYAKVSPSISKSISTFCPIQR